MQDTTRQKIKRIILGVCMAWLALMLVFVVMFVAVLPAVIIFLFVCTEMHWWIAAISAFWATGLFACIKEWWFENEKN